MKNPHARGVKSYFRQHQSTPHQKLSCRRDDEVIPTTGEFLWRLPAPSAPELCCSAFSAERLPVLRIAYIDYTDSKKKVWSRPIHYRKFECLWSLCSVRNLKYNDQYHQPQPRWDDDARRAQPRWDDDARRAQPRWDDDARRERAQAARLQQLVEPDERWSPRPNIGKYLCFPEVVRCLQYDSMIPSLPISGVASNPPPLQLDAAPEVFQAVQPTHALPERNPALPPGFYSRGSEASPCCRSRQLPPPPAPRPPPPRPPAPEKKIFRLETLLESPNGIHEGPHITDRIDG